MKTSASLSAKILLLLLALPAASAFGAMTDYCVTPPFLSQNIPPNILIVLDNSGSMCGQAYSGSYNPASFANGLYYGYFDGAKNYLYNGTRWEVTTNAMNTGTVANPIASGSFLNWATMRRTEVSKKLLIGGKANPRSPNPTQTVKLEAEIGCNTTFDKDFDTSAGNLIYPFVGDYNFENDDGNLNVTSNTGGFVTNYVRPSSDILMPAGWSEFPVNPPTIAYTKVDEAASDGDTTYIQNYNTTNAVMMGYGAYAGSEPAGTIKVKVVARARLNENASNNRKLIKILRVGLTDYESAEDSIDKHQTSYADYISTWDINPATQAAWTWDQIKKIAASDNIGGFGVRAGSTYTSGLIRITQVYLRIEVATPSGGPYNIIIDQGGVKAQGLIDELQYNVRFGLAYYNNDNGGKVNTYVDFATPVNMITSIQNMVPDTWTPLGETLYEMVRYFRQDDPYYVNTDYSPGTQSIGNPNVYRDPYAFNFGKNVCSIAKTPCNNDNDCTPTADNGTCSAMSDLPDQYVPCAKSFVLLLTDGESTMDQNVPGDATKDACELLDPRACSGSGTLPDPRFAGTTVGRTYPSNGTDYLIDVAYWARTQDMRPGVCTTVPTNWQQCLPGTQNVLLYPVYMFGTGSTLLKDASIYGGFKDNNKNGIPDCVTSPGECYRDSDGDGVVRADGSDLPLTYYEGDDGYALERNIKNAISDMLRRAASSTAVSVLSSSEGSGFTLMQSLFYPVREFHSLTTAPYDFEVSWTSDLMNYWYYMDPFFHNAQIREDTVRENSAYSLLNLQHDYITSFYFNADLGKTMAARQLDANGDGDAADVGDMTLAEIAIEDTRPLWRAGVNLWWTPPTDRTIKTSVNGTSLIDFNTANTLAIDDYLGQTASAAAATATINYVRGYDCVTAAGTPVECNDATSVGKLQLCSASRTPCSATVACPGGETCETVRNRTVPMKVCASSRSQCATSADCVPAGAGNTCVEEMHTWKLGDVVSSTPRILGPTPLNTFHITYGDTSYNDFIKTADYKGRQRVFAGANDGMVHAFRLGSVLQTWSGKTKYDAGKLVGLEGSGGIGTENWAYIPKNTLPFLQYLSKPDYCHIYMVDGPMVLTDVSINKNSVTCATDYWNCPKQTVVGDPVNTSWRSVLVGSMGIGGATCGTGAGDGCVAATDPDRVKAPVNIGGNDEGMSSYFALDVTDQASPQLLWEFSDENLGVTTPGAAIVKVGNEKRCTNNQAVCSTDSNCTAPALCKPTNGKWYAILASGPTGPVVNREFRGTADKSLKIFVRDLASGALVRTIDLASLGLTEAFAGSIISNTADLEKDNNAAAGFYQDDVVYIGYTKKNAATGTWTKGGVARLVINDADPATWTVSTVIDDIGPVTSSVANLLDRKNGKLWLYFGEGRYFYKTDDLSSQRRIFGIQDPCFDPATNSISTCATLTLANLDDQTTSPSTSLVAGTKGWYVTLDPAASPQSAERVFTNPSTDPQGGVFFLSFAPTSELCDYGGQTYLWALDYKTGGTVTYTMQGKALVQVSTGEIKELSLSDPTTFSQKDSRRSEGFKGIPPTGQGLMIVIPPTPTRKFMHVQER